MSDSKISINLVLEGDEAETLSILADRENTSLSDLALRLLIDALEHHAERGLSDLSTLRDEKEESELDDHDAAWK